MIKGCVAFFVALVVFVLPMDLAQANRTNGIAGQNAICKEKVGQKHLSGDAAKAEWKKCRENANAYK